MKEFAALFADLDGTTATSEKVAAMARYFGNAAVSDADKAWAVYFLAGGKPRQVVPTATLRALATQIAGIDDWLFDECYQAVGDLAETIALVLPHARPSSHAALGLAQWMEERLLQLRGLAEAEQAARIRSYWDELDPPGRFLLVKLIGGGFRVGVSKLLVTKALAAHAGIDAKRVAQRMMGYLDARAAPGAASYQALVANAEQDDSRTDSGQPYPFYLAHAVDDLQQLGDVREWQVEWKFDGIRAQLVKRAAQVWLWSRGEELITERFPEVCALAGALPDGTVLDGELLVWLPDAPVPSAFSLLQQRIGRKSVSKKLLSELPVVFVAYDLLENAACDVRAQPQAQRRALLEALVPSWGLRLSPVVDAASWQALAELRQGSRARGVEGFMLKHRAAAYGTGRTKDKASGGGWLKWKIEPMAVDCVLIYAQAGHGRRASLYTDYTFAVWSRPPIDAFEAQTALEGFAAKQPAEPGALQLVAFAKAYSGLSDEEIKAVDAVIRKTTLEKFGPVRSVRPSLVFELGFEGINRSSRHKSGIAVRFPRMLRLRPDKALHEADSLMQLEGLLSA